MCEGVSPPHSLVFSLKNINQCVHNNKEYIMVDLTQELQDELFNDTSSMYEELDPINNPIHALRLEFGDLDLDFPILSDQSYQYIIDTYKSPRVLRKHLGMTLAAQFARQGFRQRVGQEDAYYGERYKNYMDWLNKKLSNPFLSGNIPLVYVGGVVRETVADYETRLDLIDSTFYRGQTAQKPDFLHHRKFTRCGVIEPEEMDRRFIDP